MAPGADLGLRDKDPAIATSLKSLSYTTARFKKNYFGDKDVFLPTRHEFDEFFDSPYYLNAKEEPELPDYRSREEFQPDQEP